MKNSRNISDKDIEQLIGSVLRWGVLLSMAVVSIGGAIYLYRHGHDVSDYATFKNQPNFTIQFKAIIGGIFDLRGRAVIQFGILLLIATPIARVLLSAVSFTIEKDYLYVGISIIVLAIITISMLGGFGG